MISDDIDEAVNGLNAVIVANPGKMFNWDTSKIPGRAADKVSFMTGVTYGEWMAWDQEHRRDFVRGLRKLGMEDREG